MSTPNREEPSVSGASVSGASGALLLGQGAEFEGKLTFRGTVRIDADFTGSIVTEDVLVVGEGARIRADIACGTTVVYGEVTGNIRASKSVELYSSAKVRGNIETPSITIEKGALFDGELKMGAVEKRARVSAVAPPEPLPALQ